jgi:hypothetical protein
MRNDARPGYARSGLEPASQNNLEGGRRRRDFLRRHVGVSL